MGLQGAYGNLRSGYFRHNSGHCPLLSWLLAALRLLRLLLAIRAVCSAVSRLVTYVALVTAWAGCPVRRGLPSSWLGLLVLSSRLLPVLSSWLLLGGGVPLVQGALATCVCDLHPRSVAVVVTQPGLPGWCAGCSIVGCWRGGSRARLSGLVGMSPRL